MTGPDMINRPPHYTSHPSGVEAIEITEHLGFCLGNATKYLFRFELKNGTEDLRKAVFYLRREIQNRASGWTGPSPAVMALMDQVLAATPRGNIRVALVAIWRPDLYPYGTNSLLRAVEAVEREIAEREGDQ